MRGGDMPIVGDHGDEIGSPRALFAQSFTELYAAAGNPTLRRVADAAETRMRAAQGNRPGGASAQRISDWKAGRNVPARFESLLPVVLTLIELARKKGGPLPRPLTEPKHWQRLWHAATTWNPETDAESACPYLGLAAYRGENRALYFGRTRATTELTALVRETTGIIAVVGASGAGKSSLLAAGLAPALSDWEITALTPGAHPLTALRSAVGSSNNSARSAEPTPEPARPGADADAARLSPDSEATPMSADAEVAAALAPRTDAPRRLLIIDQFEELFTTCRNEPEREEFLTALDRCSARTDDPIAVVIALRADFYAHCLNYLALQDALEHRSYLLGPMRMDELAQAISGPARAVGLELETGLEELVITELCGAGDHHGRRTYDPGALPLLSHVMAATWQHREGRRLTITGYRRAGGVVGSVAETAEYAWNELTPDQQSAAKEILLGLVTVGQDARDTRRPAQRDNLLRRAGNTADGVTALELLSRTRLISLDAEAVNLSHEIVLTAWPRLRAWIDEDRVGYLVRQRLETDAAEWAAQDRDSSLLYQGTRLDNALDHTDPPPVGPLAAEFLTAAATARKKTRRRAAWIRARFALLGAAILIFAFSAYNQSRLADQRNDDKNFAAVLAEADRVRITDPSLAAQLDLVAYRMRPGDNEVHSRLLRSEAAPLVTTTLAHSDGVSKVVYRSDGKLLASVGASDGLRLWDTTDPLHPKSLGQRMDKVNDAAISPDGTVLAISATAADASNVVTLWDISRPDQPRQFGTASRDIPRNAVVQLAFAPSGRTLAVLADTGLALWEVGKGTEPTLDRFVPLRPQNPYRTTGILQFAPSGSLLAVALNYIAGVDDLRYALELWDVAAPTMPTRLVDLPEAVPGQSISNLAFSPDGNLLALGTYASPPQPTGGSKARVQLLDVGNPVQPRPTANLDIGADFTTAFAFAPHGNVLAVSDRDGTQLWNAGDPEHPVRTGDRLSVSPGPCSPQRHSSCVTGPNSLAFAPDGSTLTAGSLDGDIQTWSLPPAILTGHSGSSAVAAFDSSGKRLATASSDGRIQLWDTDNPLSPRRIGEYADGPGFLKIQMSPDGDTLFVRSGRPSASGSLYLLDISDPAHIHRLADWKPLLPDQADVSISPDWRRLATTDGHTVQLWDITDRVNPAALGSPLPAPSPTALQLTFREDGTRLVIQSMDEVDNRAETTATLWDIADPTHPVKISDLLHQTTPSVTSLTFSRDLSTMLVVTDNRIQSWDIATPDRPTPLGEPFAAHTLPLRSVVLAPHTLLTSSSDGTIQLWDNTDRSNPKPAGSLMLSGPQSWSVALSTDGTRAIAEADAGALRLWSLDIDAAITRICTVTSTMTADLWHRHLPHLPYHPPCPTT